MVSRHAQKSPPAARPRSARWNVWLWAFTNPGNSNEPATAATLPARSHSRSTRAQRPRSGRLQGLCATAIRASGFRSCARIGFVRDLARASPAHPERPHDRALRRGPGVHLAVPARRGRGGLGSRAFFAAAALTDQIDGYLARRWDVHTAFGKIDPLADRVMIGIAVILMWATGRIPLAAAVIVLARDLALVLGYKLAARVASSSR